MDFRFICVLCDDDEGLTFICLCNHAVILEYFITYASQYSMFIDNGIIGMFVV